MSIRSYALTACLASVGVLALAIPAQAAEGTWSVPVSRCNIKQQVQLQGSPKHDYMRWYTTGGSAQCEAWMIEKGPGEPKQKYHDMGTNNGSYYSDWIYDGPGHQLQVCANNNSGNMDCGPVN